MANSKPKSKYLQPGIVVEWDTLTWICKFNDCDAKIAKSGGTGNISRHFSGTHPEKDQELKSTATASKLTQKRSKARDLAQVKYTLNINIIRP